MSRERRSSGSQRRLARVRSRVRGCTGNTSGMSRGDSRRASQAASESGWDRRRARAMQRDERVAARRQRRAARAIGDCHAPARALPSRVSIMTLPTKRMRVASTPSRRGCRSASAIGVKTGRDGVGDDAVDLLGHRPVERAQAGLDVRDGHAALRRDERAGERRVDVADDEHGVAAIAVEPLLEARPSPGRLHGVRAGADPEVDVRLGDAQRRRRSCPTSPRRSAGRCERARRRSHVSRTRACSGATFTKFGRAPATTTGRPINVASSCATTPPSSAR